MEDSKPEVPATDMTPEQLEAAFQAAAGQTTEPAAPPEPYTPEELDAIVKADPRLAVTLGGFEQAFGNIKLMNARLTQLLMAICIETRGPCVVHRMSIASIQKDDKLDVHPDPAGRGIRIALVRKPKLIEVAQNVPANSAPVTQQHQ